MRIYSLLILIGVLLVGCASLSDFFDENQTEVRLAVQFATLKYVEGSDNQVDPERVERVHGYAQDMAVYLRAGELVTSEDLQLYVLNTVDWSALSPADAIAARTFIDYLAYEIQKRLDAAGSPDDFTFAAGFVVDTVIDTLQPYVSVE